VNLPALCAALLLIAPLVPTANTSSQTSRESDTRQLQQLEQVWNKAHIDGDADALDRLWADDLEVSVPRMAVMNKTDALAFARSGRMKFLRYTTSGLNIRVYKDAAVVSGRLQRTRSMNGKEISDDWQFTKVYIRQGKRWRVVSFHASDAPQS
jgi:hypothetical protein